MIGEAEDLRQIVKYYGEGKAKIIYGNNCIAHLDDLHDLLLGVKTLLTDDGIFVVECNYWGGMVANKNYSLIYHDHFSYFTVHTWIQLAQMHGLFVFDAIVTPAQGGSLRIFMSNNEREKTGKLQELIAEEINTNLNSYETCFQYRRNCETEAKKLNRLLNKLFVQN